MNILESIKNLSKAEKTRWIILFRFHYYGEMLTYIGMTTPSALWAMIMWLKNPYLKREVKVGKMTKVKWCLLVVSAVIVTLIMWRGLVYFNTANILFSTISVTTSYLASMLMVLRSPCYAVCYAANDIILIVLWVLATSGSSGMGNTNQELAGSCPGAELKEGKRFPADASAEELKAWSEGFGI